MNACELLYPQRKTHAYVSSVPGWYDETGDCHIFYECHVGIQI